MGAARGSGVLAALDTPALVALLEDGELCLTGSEADKGVLGKCALCLVSLGRLPVGHAVPISAAPDRQAKEADKSTGVGCMVRRHKENRGGADGDTAHGHLQQENTRVQEKRQHRRTRGQRPWIKLILRPPPAPRVQEPGNLCSAFLF